MYVYPVAEHTKRVDFRVAPEDIERLARLARRAGISRSDWVRMAIRLAYEETFGTAKPRMPRKRAAADAAKEKKTAV